MANDHIVSRAYVEDPTGQLSLKEVRALPATEFTGVLSKGYSTSAFWIRLRIDDKAATSPHLTLRIMPSFLDEIRLFDPLDSNAGERVTGDHYDWRLSEYKSLNHNFLIPAGTAPRDIWLRLKTSSSSLIYLEALTPDDTQNADRLQEMAYDLMISLLLVFFLWGVVQWSQRRERMMGFFVLSQLMAIVYAVVYVGYARILLSSSLPATTIDLFTNTIFCIYVTVGIYFHYEFLAEFQPPRWALRLFPWFLVLAFPIELFWLATEQTQQALRVNVLLTTIMSVYVFALALNCRAWINATADAQPTLSKAWLIGFYSFIIAALWTGLLPTLGIAQTPEFNLHVYLIHGMMTGLILTVILQIRGVRAEKLLIAATVKARTAATLAEIEMKNAETQSNFMGMLAHELKGSLGVLRMLLDLPRPSAEMVAHGKESVKSINDLVERYLQAEKFDDQEMVSKFESIAIVEVLDEIMLTMSGADRLRRHIQYAPVIESDRQIVRTVLSNLIDNALKYSPPDSTVTLTINSVMRENRETCEIRIENRIVSDFPDPAGLFKKYYRSDTSRKHSGSGLGLYLVSNFTRMVGGDVIYTPLEDSVRFTVWFPK